jgi:O-antigen ligase/Flp pilus assembly protein TadD
MGKRSREKRERVMSQVESDRFVPVLGERSFKEKLYLSIIKWGTYLILLTPLIASENFFFPYVVPKTVFFRILVDIIFIAYLLLITTAPRYKPKFSALSWSIVAFFAVSLIASILGVDFFKSFWGSFERMTGLITFAHLFAFFLVLTSVFRERKHWEMILTISILIGVILVFYVSISSDPTTRGGGTIGNTSFMSTYLLFNIFFALILFLSKRGWLKLLYGLGLAIMVWRLFFSQEPTQGAIGAFWGGLFLFALSYLLFRLFSSQRRLRAVGLGLIAFLVLFGAVFSQTDFLKNKIKDISESTSWQSREVVWNMSIQGVKERPWLGWGEENFTIPFGKYYDPALPVSGDSWYDRAHNIVFDVLISSGIIGLLAYLSIFFFAIIGLLRILRNLKDKNDSFIALGTVSLLAVYFAQNLWVFDMITSYMMFFLTLSFIYFLIQNNKQETVAEEPVKKPYKFFFALMIIAALASIYWGNIKPAQSSNYIIRAKYISSSEEELINYYEKVIETSPIALQEGSEQFATEVSEMVFDQNASRDALAQGFFKAEAAIKKAIDSSPNSFRTRLVFAKFYNSFSNLNDSQQMLDLAREVLEKAKELSPANQQVYWEFAQNELYRGDQDKAIEYMQKSIDLEPQYAVSYWYTALVYRSMGDSEKAWEYMQAAQERGYEWDASLDDLIKVISVNQVLENYQELISLYDAALRFDPKNAKLAGGMAVSLANVGSIDAAKTMASYALELDPSLKDALQPILDIEN